MLNSSGTDWGMGEINHLRNTNATTSVMINTMVELSMNFLI